MNKNVIETLIQFIDIMASRGSIRGDELRASGELREILEKELSKYNEDSGDK